MKKMLCIMLLAFACGRTDQHAELMKAAQIAVDETTHAIVSNDVSLFKTRWAPELYEASGSTIAERDIEAEKFMATQREGIRGQYGEEPPVVLSVEEHGSELWLTISVDGTEATKSPKPLYMRREADGRLVWLGIRVSGERPAMKEGVAQQALSGLYGTYYMVNWDVQNQSNTVTHFLEETYATSWPFVPLCGPGEACYNHPECVVGPNLGTHGLGDGAFQHNFNGWVNAYSRYYSGNNNYAMALISPVGGGIGSITCGNGATSVSTNYCCWINGFGYDLWWNSSSGQTYPPYCSSSWCPP